MKTWPKRVLRAIGTINLAWALLGAVSLGGDIYIRARYFASHPGLADPRGPHGGQLFWLGVALEAAYLLLLTLVGLWVARLQRRGLWSTNALFSFQIVRYFVLGWAWYSVVSQPYPPHLASAIVSVPVGSVMEIEFLIGYPFIALIATNIAYSRLGDRAVAQEGLTSPQP